MKAAPSGTRCCHSDFGAEIETLPLRQQSGHRILLPLLRPDDQVDFHLADYLIGWSEDEGLSDAVILDAFDIS
jgi:hypothetical protein